LARLLETRAGEPGRRPPSILDVGNPARLLEISACGSNFATDLGLSGRSPH
jgi:hypothetical protein